MRKIKFWFESCQLFKPEKLMKKINERQPILRNEKQTSKTSITNKAITLTNK